MNTSERLEFTSNINNTIDIINKGSDWVNFFLKGEQRLASKGKITKMRRELKKIKFAQEETPAAAMFGESQVGKSYLIGSLLSLQGNPFMVKDPSGKEYNFIDEINPEGKGTESTSTVTRFTIRENKSANNEYPIRVKLLSPINLLLSICDSFYNDIEYYADNDYKLEQEIENLAAKYSERKEVQNYIQEDDIYDVEEYFNLRFKSKRLFNDILGSDYFEVVADLIGKMNPEEWIDAFRWLWNDNKVFNSLYADLMTEYKKLDFAEECYIKFRAVLRKYGTLLSVDRLKELNGGYTPTDLENYEDSMEVCVNNKKQTIKKSYFCALLSEIVFNIDKDLAIKKPFLEETDLLDFPGARARLNYHESSVEVEYPELLLRGKVAYFFNRYSDAYLIKNLLLCHHQKQAAPRYIPQLLDSWVAKNIGDTPESRELYMKKMNVPPLFIIGTYFNLDLKCDKIALQAKEKSPNKETLIAELQKIWHRRFDTVLEPQIIGTESSWFNSWTTSEKNFKNIYLLRDFYYSSDIENNIYEGYTSEKPTELRLVRDENFLDFFETLKESFTEYPFIKKHFDDPSYNWNEAADINKDGTELIISKLNQTASNESRDDKLIRDYNKQIVEFNIELNKYYHDDDKDNAITKAVSKAGEIQMNFDTIQGEDKYFFGKMMEKFIVNESDTYNYYLKKIDDINLIAKTDLSKYVFLREANPELDMNADFNFNLEVLKKNYKQDSTEDMMEYFANQNIDLHELFYGDKNVIKSNSKILAEGLTEKWFSEYLSIDNFKNLIKQGFSENSAIELITMIKELYKKLNVEAEIVKNIKQYVDRYDKIDTAMEMIADISSQIINKFINSVGFDFYTVEDMAAIRKANEENNLELLIDNNYLSFTSLETEELTNLFDTLDKLDEILNTTPLDKNAIRNVPSFSMFVKWKNLMKVAFVGTCDIPMYDVFANDRLGEVIKESSKLT